MSGRWEGKEIREEDLKKYLDMLRDPEKFGEYLHTAMHGLEGDTKAPDPMDDVMIHFRCTVSEAIQLCLRLQELRGNREVISAYVPPTLDDSPLPIPILPNGGLFCNRCGKGYESLDAFNSHPCINKVK